MQSIWVRRGLFVVLVVGVLVYVPHWLLTNSTWSRYFKLKAARDQMHKENIRLYEENLKLKEQIDALGEGPALPSVEIERIARDELNLVKPAEVVFYVNEAPPKESVDAQPRRR